MDNMYAIAYSEILEILKYIPQEEYNKIPQEKIELFKAKADKNYKFRYDPRKKLNEQEVSKIAKGIIAILYRDYWATPEQRKIIKDYQKMKRSKIEEEKRNKYNANDLFKSKIEINQNKKNGKELIEYKESIFKKLIKMIRKLKRR